MNVLRKVVGRRWLGVWAELCWALGMCWSRAARAALGAAADAPGGAARLLLHLPPPEVAAPAAVGVGLLLGLALLWWLPAPLAPALPLAPVSRRDLQARLTLAVENLREFADRAARLDASERAREQLQLEQQAEQALAALQALAQAPPVAAGQAARPTAASAQPARSPATQFLAARPRLQGALWGGLSVGLATFLLTTVRDGSSPQAPPAAAGPASAPSAAGAPGGPSAINERELAALKAALAQDPNDLPALLRLAHLALQVQELEQADMLTRRVLALDPKNLEARTHLAVLAAGHGDAAAAETQLVAILTEQPSFAEAWFFRGMLGMQAGDMDKMRQCFGQFVQVAPDGPQKERIRAMLARSRTD